MLAHMSFPSPMGVLRLHADEVALVGVFFPEHRGAPRVETVPVRRHPVLELASAELDEYFRGVRQVFTTPLAVRGSAFQNAVWALLRGIPFGARRSYADLARALERPRAVRAVGSANGRNPLSIFVPCHRVVAADGRLSGYAGGVASKQWLLDHEQRVLARAGVNPAL
jgi:methylated-DNA-[protein]-cysteine S-methyltransferase